MGKAGQFFVAALAGVVLGLALLVWAGLGTGSQVLGLRLGAYRPPVPPSYPHGAVAAEAKARGLVLGDVDTFADRLGYVDRSDVCTYRGQWSATRDSKPVSLRVGMKTSGGKWVVTEWSER